MEHKVIDCSLKSILNITIPMMLSIMSTNFMLLIDRFMLSGYSIDAMNAVSMSSGFVGMLVMAIVGISDTAEVFVGQYNGSKQYDRLAAPVWQMFYLSMMAPVIFLPMAYFSDYINFLPEFYLKDGVDFQRILLCFMVLPSVKTALSTFFVGQGKTKIVTSTVVIGATINVVLDYFLIYGINGLFDPMGARGAAIATVIAEFMQVVVFSLVFFNKRNRGTYKTLKNYRFNKELFLSCLKIGAPMSFGNFVCFLAWCLVQAVVNHVSKDAATVYNISASISMVFYSLGEGINKGSAAICSNMIGRKDLVSIEKTFGVFINMSLFFGLIIAVPLVIFPSWILHWFDMSSTMYSEVKIVFYLVTITASLDMIVFSTYGILIAGGDTKYAATVNQVSLWLFVVFPIAVLYSLNLLSSVPVVYLCMSLWLVVTQLFLYRRYRSLKWYNKLV